MQRRAPRVFARQAPAVPSDGLSEGSTSDSRSRVRPRGSRRRPPTRGRGVCAAIRADRATQRGPYSLSLILPFDGRGTGHSARPNFPESAVLYPQRWSGERPSASQGRPSRSFVSPRCHGVVGGRRSREDRPPARGGGGCPAGRRHGGVCVCSSRKFFTRKSQQRERLLRRCLGDT